MRNVVSAVLLGAALFPALASAQSIGEAEYMNSCAACHGPGGTGGGPLAGLLMGSLPDLTQLAAANGSVFPVSKVFATIDGTMTSGPHGSGEMPVLGEPVQDTKCRSCQSGLQFARV